jgi:hypothetical protein
MYCTVLYYSYREGTYIKNEERMKSRIQSIPKGLFDAVIAVGEGLFWQSSEGLFWHGR